MIQCLAGMEVFGHLWRPRKFTIANIIRIGMFPCAMQTCMAHPRMLTRRFEFLQARDKQKLDQKGRAYAWLGAVVYTNDTRLSKLI